MKHLSFVSTVLSLALLSSCGGSGETNTQESTEKSGQEEKTEICMYSYQNEKTTVAWDAFKFTEKTAVGGAFDIVQVEGTSESTQVENVLTGATFTIPVSSTNTNNPDRDQKIVEHFFGTNGVDTISGKVVSITPNNEGFDTEITLTMGENTQKVLGTLSLSDNMVTLTATIDVANWGGMPGIEKLNEICHDLHIGKDGVSKLWSEVDLKISTELKKECI